jgi:hypothetical protein
MKARSRRQGRGIRAPLYTPRPRKRKTSKRILFLELSIIFISIIFFMLLLLSMTPIMERPSSGLLYTLGSSLGFSMNQSSSSDFVTEEQIEIQKDRIIIYIPNAIMSSYAATGSMLPVINHTANGIEIPVTSVDQIHVGDIIAFQLEKNSSELIVHRVIEIGYDNEGWYCITKGDNNLVDDGKIREWQIKFKTIIIIY